MHTRYIGPVILISTVGYVIMSDVKRYKDRRETLNEHQFLESIILREHDRQQDKVKSLGVEYDKSVKQDALNSMEICKKWTCTKCETAIDIVPFLEKYAKMKAVKEYPFAGIISTEDLEDLEDLEDFKEIEQYRRSEIHFWLNEVKQEGIQLNSLGYPGHNELKFFSTFHWAIYMVVSNCVYNNKDFIGGEPYTYKWVEKTIYNTDEEKEYIETYRKTIKKEFPRIQNEIFKNIP